MTQAAKHIVSVLLFLCYLNTHIAAQAITDSVLARQRFDQGLELYKARDFTSAMTLFEEAAQIHLRDQDTSYALYSYKFVGASLIQKERLREFLDFRPVLMPLLKARDEEVPATLTLLGTAAMNYGDFKLAHSYFDSALVRAATLDSVSNLIRFNIGSLYLNQGRLFVKEGDYDRALLNYQHALGIFADPTLPEPGRFYATARALHNMGHAHELKGEFATALQYNDQVDELLLEHPHRTIQIQNLNNQGIAHRNLGQYQDALARFRTQLTLQSEEDPKRGRSLKQIGETFLAMQQPDSALPYLMEAKTFREMEYGKLPHPNMSKLLVLIGDCSMQKGKPDEALRWYQQAQARLCLPLSIQDVHTLPPSRQILFPLDLLPVLKAKGMAEEALYQQTGQIAHLHSALNTYQLADTTLDIVRRSLDLEGSKLVVSGQARPLFEGGIRVASILYQENQDPKWLKVAFHFAEKNRATLLKESVRQTGERRQGLVPDSLWDIQRSLSLQIGNLRKDLSKSSPHQIAEDSTFRELESQLFDSQLQLDSIREAISLSHPSFSDFLTNSVTPSPIQVRQFLHPDQSLIEYFVGDSAMFVICISEKRTGLINLGSPLLIQESISEIRQMTQSAQGNPFEFSGPAANLYKILVAPLEPFLQNDRLIIVPDGLLHLLPFELLLTHSPTSSESYRQLPYLLRKWAISYQFSSGLMMEKDRLSNQTNTPSIQNNGKASEFQTPWTGFAPDYASDRSGLTPLLSASKEISTIGTLYRDSPVNQGPQASKTRFLELIEGGSPPEIVHLACHAKAVSDQGTGSWIAFSDKNSDDFRLTLDEIYHLSSAPQVVILSACETGVGPLNKAEGALSLARGFYLSGSQTVLNSMWQVRDGSSQFLMEHFYQQMLSGKAMDVALQQAMLTYLESESFGEAYMAPHYWAGFRVTGEPAPFQKKNGNGAIWWILAGVSILLLWWYRT